MPSHDMTRVSVDLRKDLQNVRCLELFDIAIAFFVFSLCYSDRLDLDLSKLDIFLVFSLCYTDRLDLELELDLEKP